MAAVYPASMEIALTLLANRFYEFLTPLLFVSLTLSFRMYMTSYCSSFFGTIDILFLSSIFSSNKPRQSDSNCEALPIFLSSIVYIFDLIADPLLSKHWPTYIRTFESFVDPAGRVILRLG